MLRHREDRRSLAMVALALAWLVAGLGLAPAWALPIWSLGQFILSFICSIINHNHTHCPIFRSPLANRLFNPLLTIAKGHTVQTVIVPHQMNHHPRAGGPGDWIAVAHAGSGPGLIRLVRYVARGARTMASERRRPGAPRLPPRLAAQLREEQAALAVFVITSLLLVGPTRVLLAAALPWLGCMAALVAVNLPQHDGCDPSDPLRSSRDFTSPFTNWLLFNNGYHTVHHLEPGLHWSRAAEAHRARVRPRRSAPDLAAHERRSLLWYMLTELGRP